MPILLTDSPCIGRCEFDSDKTACLGCGRLRAEVKHWKTLDAAAMRNHFARIAAPQPQGNEVRLVQDAEIWAAKLDAGVEAIHPLEPGRRAWLQLVTGEISVDGHALAAGDAAAVSDQNQVAVRSLQPSEMLLFDLA